MTREYTEDHARTAVRRHEARTIDERLRLLRSMLSSAAGDTEPHYSGIDPADGPFKGPPTWQWPLGTLAYFVASSQTTLGESISEVTKAEIRWAIADGIRMAEDHRRLSASYTTDTEVTK